MLGQVFEVSAHIPRGTDLRMKEQNPLTHVELLAHASPVLLAAIKDKHATLESPEGPMKPGKQGPQVFLVAAQTFRFIASQEYGTAEQSTLLSEPTAAATS